MRAKKSDRTSRHDGAKSRHSLRDDLLWCLGLMILTFTSLVLLVSVTGCGDLHIHFDKVQVYQSGAPGDCSATTTQPGAPAVEQSIEDMIKERL